ncbi:MAG: biotin attachment protein, partial [Pedobacter sp.]
DDPWPPQLRQGSGVYGRIILRAVPLWYEIWRQLNGFPPSLDKEPSESKDKK